MSGDRIQHRALPIVGELLDLAPEQRQAALANACGNDAELLAEVRSLLSASDGLATAHPFSDGRINDQRSDAERALGGSRVGPQSVGKYHVLQELGRGGMSVVYECEQDNPSRRVAVKLMDSRLSTPAMNRRLRLEAEILGRLRHECIATVHEAGVTPKSEGSRPYFAMELVEGVPLTDYAERSSLDKHARLQLLARVADGVEHAHQKGVIHRDLKPGNILVTPDGVPKILDFGIARVTDADIKTTTMHTSAGAILGTISYMSPEQASADPGAVDTRSDVYSLGVLGFELLSGRLPHAVDDTPIHEAVRMIREDPPTTLATLETSLRGDIDTMIAKALETDPDRRYASAAAFADDLRRYLNDQPIAARPPSVLYQLRKFSRRHTAVVLGITATVIVLIGGVLFSTYFALGERQQRRLADAREQRARESSAQASYGLLSSALFFAEEGRPWTAFNLLYTVPESNRGWVWKHISLRTPWVLEFEQHLPWAATDVARPAGFLNDSEMLLYTSGGTISRLNLVTGVELPIIDRALADAPILRGFSWSTAPVNTPALLSRTKTLVIDAITAKVTPSTVLPPIDPALPGEVVSFSHDRSLASVLAYSIPKLAFYDVSGEVFALDSGREAGTGRQWFFSHFLRTRPYVIANRWDNELFVIDTRTWEVVRERQIPTANQHMGMGVLPDESAAYFSTETGVELRSIPEFELLDTFATEYGACAQVRLSSDGRYLSASYPEEQILRVFDTRSWQPVFEHETQQTYLQWRLHFAPNGRLLYAPNPDEGDPWIIDPEEPPGSHISVLDGHESAVDQLAVSPDGSLLASAAPEGDVLLWDLERGRVLVRFERIIDYKHNIDAPLVFSADGSSLLFGERLSNDPAGRTHGLRIVDVLTGDSTTAAFATRDELLDDLASRLMPVAPCTLHSHVALLPDGRLLMSSADQQARYGVRVRAPGQEPVLLPSNGGTVPPGGVTVSPDGSTVTAGEWLTTRVRDAETMEIVHQIADAQTGNDANKPWGKTYSPDGSLLAFGTELGEVMVYETEFFQKICDLRLPRTSPDADRNAVYRLLWTPDGSRLITTTSRFIRILESERHITREHRRSVWNRKLQAARDAVASTEDRPASVDPGAWRIAKIERWAGASVPSQASAGVR